MICWQVLHDTAEFRTRLKWDCVPDPFCFQAPIARIRLAACRRSRLESVRDGRVHSGCDPYGRRASRNRFASHPEGPKFQVQLGSAAAGESQRVTIPAMAKFAGQATISAKVTGSPDREALVEFASLVR